MWELIQSNKRKSLFLFFMMGTFLLVLGYLVGEYYFQGGGPGGVVMASIIWVIFSLISYFGGSTIMLSVSGAQEVTKKVHPQLFNVVEEMTIAAGLSKMPKVYIINDASPNAFATGRTPDNSAIAVTAGLLAKCTRDELQGVIAHEMSHILNRDVQFMTFAGVLLGTIVIVSELFLRSLWMGGGSRGRYSKKSEGGGQLQIILMVVSILFAILGPIFAQLLYFAISRKREYLADASGVRLTRYPEGLASALEKIAGDTAVLQRANKATAGMYIINPLKKQGKAATDLTSTHPPISERIRILRGMAAGAGLLDYQMSYSRVKGKSERIIPDSELNDKEKVEKRTSGKIINPNGDPKTIQRELGDLMMTVNKYMFLTCICGLKMKIPPEYKKETIECPKCHHINKVPLAELTAAGAILKDEGIAHR